MPEQGAPTTLFNSKRTDLLDLYAKNGVPFLATTRGLSSVRSIAFDAIDIDLVGNNVGYLVARKGQSISFFNYGINDSIELSGDPTHRANEADTSLTTGRRTTASADLSIEWITMHPRAIKVQYTPTIPAAPSSFPDFVAAAIAVGDPVGEMLAGQAAIVDPFGLVVPADVGSSATLQHVLYQAIAPHLTCRFEWDNADRTEKMGTCDQFVEGGGASYLNSNGEPSVNNRFRIPEGFLWARESQPASQLEVIVELRDNVVIPYSPVAAPVTGVHTVLQHAYVEILMRLGGLLLRVPGSN
jgi:hypothetical protein